jgi:hypothetical protein
MGDYCIKCHIFYKNLNSKKCCNSCSSSVNNFMYQHESKLKKELVNNTIQFNYRLSAKLQDFAADALIHNLEDLKTLAEILPEGHPPWHTLIKAWQRHKKIKIRSTKHPKEKLFKLLGHPISNTL